MRSRPRTHLIWNSYARAALHRHVGHFPIDDIAVAVIVEERNRFHGFGRAARLLRRVRLLHDMGVLEVLLVDVGAVAGTVVRLVRARVQDEGPAHLREVHGQRVQTTLGDVLTLVAMVFGTALSPFTHVGEAKFDKRFLKRTKFLDVSKHLFFSKKFIV